MPYCPRYLTHHYEQYTYPIQDKDTKAAIASLKNELRQAGIYLWDVLPNGSTTTWM